MLGNVGEVGDGAADGVGKFGSVEQAEASTGGVRAHRPLLRGEGESILEVRKEHCWFIVLLMAQKEGNLFPPLWPQTLPCPCTGFARAGEKNHVLQHDRAILRQLRHRYQGEEAEAERMLRKRKHGWSQTVRGDLGPILGVFSTFGRWRSPWS